MYLLFGELELRQNHKMGIFNYYYYSGSCVDSPTNL